MTNISSFGGELFFGLSQSGWKESNGWEKAAASFRLDKKLAFCHSQA